MNATYVVEPSACEETQNVKDVRTPAMAISSLCSCQKNDISNERNAILKDAGLIEMLWKTYCVDALNSFSFKRKDLRKYQKKLKSYVTKATKRKGKFINKNFIIEIRSYPEMAFTERDYPGLKITIVSEESDDDRTVHFTGFLLSVERERSVIEKSKPDAIILPLFLVDCDKKIFLNTCIKFLKKNFKCCVKPLEFSVDDLTRMLGLWSFPQKCNCKKSSICLEYETQIKEIDSIDYAIDPFTVAKIWEGLVEPDAEELSDYHISTFMSILEDHYFNMFSIRLSHLQLRVIKTPVARVNGYHSIIVRDCCKLFTAMRHLTHLAQKNIKETSE